MPRQSPDLHRPASKAPETMRCLCATVRRASRLLTRRYEEALRPTGVTVSQFELLQTLRTAGPLDQRRLAEITETDQTTLSRSLKLLVAGGWIAARGSAEDGRVRVYGMSDAGSAVLDRATAAWTQVQQEVQADLEVPMAELFPVLECLMRVAGAGSSSSFRPAPE